MFGVTFLVVAPENVVLNKILENAINKSQVEAYLKESKQKTDLERKSSKEKSGIEIEGVFARNPITDEVIPIWVSDYVLSTYGTGAIMGVPAHDENDNEFAIKFNLKAKEVISLEGVLINSNEFTGQDIEKARDNIAKKTGASFVKKFKMRDWVFSRQRFWGEPFPIVWINGESNYLRIKGNSRINIWLPENAVRYTDEYGQEWFALPILPQYLDSVKLPDIKSYVTSKTGEGPLATIPSWVNTFINVNTGEVKNNIIGDEWIPVRRETNTMPQWAGSSWYYLRYIDCNNLDEPFDKKKVDAWVPTNVYSGADHATAHLIYARFWHKVLFDAEMLSSIEPFTRLEFLGYILAPDGSKISKRKGNNLKPDDIIAKVGADAFRLYEMFLGPFEKAIPWKEDGPNAMKKFIDRIWKITHKIRSLNIEDSSMDVKRVLHQTIKKVGEDIESFKFNTAIAQMMSFLNVIEKDYITKDDFLNFIQVLAPFAPFLSEEIWGIFGQPFSIHTSAWPVYDASIVQNTSTQISIQINGKMRSTLLIYAQASKEEVINAALLLDEIKHRIGERKINNIIYVPGRIINFVIE